MRTLGILNPKGVFVRLVAPIALMMLLVLFLALVVGLPMGGATR